jgi:hypothetical protein
MISTFWFGAVASARIASMYFSATRKFAAARSPAGDRVADHGGRLGLRLGQALPGFGIAERRFLATFGGEDLRLLVALGLEDCGLAQPFRLQHRRAFLALGLHLAGHRAGEVGRRQDVLDLDAGDLEAPGRGGGVHHAQEALVDLVAMREQVVKRHRADHGADVRHRQREKRLLEVRNLIGGPGWVEDLVEGGGVNGDAGVVAGEGLLARHVEHLLHHVDLLADAFDVRDDQPEPRPERAREAPELLDRVGVALRDGAHAERDRHDDQDDERDDEDVEAERDWHCGPLLRPLFAAAIAGL